MDLVPRSGSGRQRLGAARMALALVAAAFFGAALGLVIEGGGSDGAAGGSGDEAPSAEAQEAS